jgi:hypothetical protein
MPEPCDGACTRVTELDGRVLGFCDAGCAEGSRECLTGPLYRDCRDGKWSSVVHSCEDGAACLPVAAGPLVDVKCGGDCESGTSRCSADGLGVESCSQAEKWESLPVCALGRCLQAGAQAQCQTECKPGEHACAFDGDARELRCDEHGLWGEPSTCAAGASCRVGSLGALGCLECVGPTLPGGNVWGVVDSRCGAGGPVACGADNLYGAVEPCAAGACLEIKRGAASLAYCK